MLPRLDALDGPPGAGTPTRGRQLGDGVGSGVTLGRAARRVGIPCEGLEPGYAYRRSGGRIPQSLPRGRFGGGLRQLHLSAAWTSHNTPAFDFAAAHSN